MTQVLAYYATFIGEKGCEKGVEVDWRLGKNLQVVMARYGTGSVQKGASNKNRELGQSSGYMVCLVVVAGWSSRSYKDREPFRRVGNNSLALRRRIVEIKFVVFRNIVDVLEIIGASKRGIQHRRNEVLVRCLVFRCQR